MLEIFIPIKGYKKLYEISNFGRVKSLKKFRKVHSGIQVYPERILKLEKTYKGYLRVMLSKYGKCKKIYVHRLVGQTFLPLPNSPKEINHKNFKKSDNRVSNLEWLTGNENIAHFRKMLYSKQVEKSTIENN